MADITAECLLKHRQLLMCRRADLGIKVNNLLSQGANADCEKMKMKRIDTLMKVLCRYKPDNTLNCLTNSQVDGIISYLYTVLPEAC